MKLRNKTTGEIISKIDVSQDHEGIWVMENKPRLYRTLAELNEEWEDYKPKYPFINDGDARDAVDSWASVHQIHDVRCRKTMRGLGIDVTIFEAIGLHSAPKIEFASLDADVEDGKIYNTVELCGEDEE